MNKGFTQTNKIYIIKYRDIFLKPEVGITTNRTYNLKAFKDLNKAKEYFDEVFNDKIGELTKHDTFKIILDVINEEEGKSEEGYTLRIRKVRLIGGKLGNNQSRTLTFSIEIIELH